MPDYFSIFFKREKDRTLVQTVPSIIIHNGRWKDLVDMADSVLAHHSTPKSLTITLLRTGIEGRTGEYNINFGKLFEYYLAFPWLTAARDYLRGIIKHGVKYILVSGPCDDCNKAGEVLLTTLGDRAMLTLEGRVDALAELADKNPGKLWTISISPIIPDNPEEHKHEMYALQDQHAPFNDKVVYVDASAFLKIIDSQSPA